MKKLSMQELADALDCYVAKDQNGIIHCFEKKPKYPNISEKDDHWAVYDQYGNFDWKDGFFMELPLTDKEEHDWLELVSPKNKSEA